MRYLLLAPALLALSGCITSRYVASDAKLASYHYCVVPKATGHGWADITESVWRPLFEVIPEDDPRLIDTATRAVTCIAITDAGHGLWHCTAKTELRDYATNEEELIYNTSRGVLYCGAHAAVNDALFYATGARRLAVLQHPPAAPAPPAADPGSL